ncbi:hypothetical protein L3i20_v246460 [Paenibacillus sp. L3-i20]|nr:hypothetical protein L3i20_v246460 [Paenibacillus sp. L3-i20]
MNEQLEVINGIEIRFNKVMKNFLEQAVDESMIDMSFIDLGINSIAFIKLIVALEDEFEIEFEDMSLGTENFSTLKSLREYIEVIIKESA